MTKGLGIKTKIQGIFAYIRNKYPHITDDDLFDGGAIFYMNGNDGTMFDWDMNGRTCEFYMFHKNEIGFIKVYVNSDDTYTAHIYPKGEISAADTLHGKLADCDSAYLAALLDDVADKNDVWDVDIDHLDFSHVPDEVKVERMRGI